MPRQPRLDAPGVLHHVMVRGIERRPLFRDDADRGDFVARLAALAAAGALTVYAWALLANHAHLLVRTGARPLARSLRSLLIPPCGTPSTGATSGAGTSSRIATSPSWWRRSPTSWSSSATSTSTRSARGVSPTSAPSTGTPGVGTAPCWGGCPARGKRRGRSSDTSPPGSRGRGAYRAFVAQGIPQGRRPELQGGGLVRSLGGWTAVAALRRGREAYAADERVLGAPAFVEELLQAAAPAERPLKPPALLTVLGAVAAALGLPPAALASAGRAARVARAREGAAYLWCRVAGQSGRVLAAALGLSHQAVYAAATRGERAAARWQAVWQQLQ